MKGKKIAFTWLLASLCMGALSFGVACNCVGYSDSLASSEGNSNVNTSSISENETSDDKISSTGEESDMCESSDLVVDENSRSDILEDESSKDDNSVEESSEDSVESEEPSSANDSSIDEPEKNKYTVTQTEWYKAMTMTNFSYEGKMWDDDGDSEYYISAKKANDRYYYQEYSKYNGEIYDQVEYYVLKEGGRFYVYEYDIDIKDWEKDEWENFIDTAEYFIAMIIDKYDLHVYKEDEGCYVAKNIAIEEDWFVDEIKLIFENGKLKQLDYINGEHIRLDFSKYGTTEVDFHTHNWVESVAKESDCFNDGEMLVSCACGESYTYPISAGHAFSGWDMEESPLNCQQVVEMVDTCTRCGETRVEVIQGSHYFDDGVVVKQATCQQDGELLFTCTVCGETDSEPIWGDCNWIQISECVWECEYCQEQEIEHGETETAIVEYDGMNLCEDIHYVAETCIVCGEELDRWYSPPFGHKYVYVSDEKIDSYEYSVTLECEACKKAWKEIAYLSQSIESTCVNEGYKIYAYEYEYESQIQIGTIEKKESRSDEHVISDGEYAFRIKVNETIVYTAENTETIEYLIEKGLIICSTELACTKFAQATAECKDCGAMIPFEICGPHSYDEEELVLSTCTQDGYYPCLYCGYQWYAEELLAVGHQYEYVKDTFNENKMTAVVKCSVCEVEETSGLDSEIERFATSCMDIYRESLVTNISNGLPDGHINYKKSSIAVMVYEEAAESHLLYVEGEVALQLCSGMDYDYNYSFETAIDSGVLVWGTQKGSCITYGEAKFICSKCEQEISIYLSGPHDLEETELQTFAPTCIEYGYTFQVCPLCGNEIIVEILSANGHSVEWNVVGVDENQAGYALGECENCDIELQIGGVESERTDEYVVYSYYLNDKKVMEDVTIYFS